MMKFNPVKMEPIALVDRCIEELNTRVNAGDAKPMSKVAIDCLRLDGKKLPPSLARYLAFDCSFYSMSSNWGEFSNIDPIGAETPNEWDPVFLEEEITHTIEELAWRPINELKLFLTKDKAAAGPMDYLSLELDGKLFRLPNVGNQTHFLYVGVADKHGEYPVLGFEFKGDIEHSTKFWGQLNVWVKYPNFAVYLYDQIFDSDVYPDDFVAELDEIYHNNPELSRNFKGSLELLK
ncbi:MAG: hypothetical protein K2X77_10430 [Candidatus Obscuribacterales bacterium]|nr:hypothetical protein [Candidatus Obscuribacterales bacterium]